MPIEDDYRERLNALLKETDEMLDIPLTPAWRAGLVHLKQTLEYVTPRLGAAHPRPFLLDGYHGVWQLTKPDGSWYRRYRDLATAVADATQNDWLYVYVNKNDRYALSRLCEAPETTAEMYHWITDTINGEDAPVRPTRPGTYALTKRGDAFHFEMGGQELFTGQTAEDTLRQLSRFSRREDMTAPVHMDADVEHELGCSYPYVDMPAREWLRDNRYRLRLAAIQEHFNQRIADGIGWQSR